MFDTFIDQGDEPAESKSTLVRVEKMASQVYWLTAGVADIDLAPSTATWEIPFTV
jgi:hypothetical protein